MFDYSITYKKLETYFALFIFLDFRTVWSVKLAHTESKNNGVDKNTFLIKRKKANSKAIVSTLDLI